MFNLARIIGSRNWNQNFTVNRMAGGYVKGYFVPTVTVLNLDGAIIPHKTRKSVKIPAGDTIEGAIDIYTSTTLMTASQNATLDGTGNLPDEVIWRGDTYKIISEEDFSDYGFNLYAAVRKSSSLADSIVTP